VPRTSLEADKAEILNLHREWWLSNEKLNVDRMVDNFAVGDSYFMFNLNKFSYFGVQEKVGLWEYLHQWDVDWTELETFLITFEIWGDTAWLAVEGKALRKTSGPEGDRILRFRSTEIYHRDDGAGAANWRIWHLHVSESAPVEAPRPGTAETAEQHREFGSVAGRKPVRLLGA
jgi:hypothetical protein